jgi:hypothetical protein
MSVNAHLLSEQPLEKPDKLIQEYIRLRDQKKAAEDKMDAWLKLNFSNRIKEIEAGLSHHLASMGVESFKTEHGTAFTKTETSVTVADATEFKRHVIGTEDWGLIDFRANKTAVKEFVENNEGLLPPGVNMTQTAIVQVRKPA